MSGNRMSEWKGAIKAILVIAMLCVGIGIAFAAWNDVKSTSDALTAAEWNAQVDDQQNRTNAATLVIAASDSRIASTADYVCDGTADQTEINNAITALSSTGGEIKLLEGNYSITGTINLKDSITLTGCGWNTIITPSSAISGNKMFNIQGIEDVIIQDICMDGDSRASLNAVVICPSGATPSKHIRIKNCEMRNLGYMGVYLESTTVEQSDIRVENNWMHNVLGCGLRLTKAKNVLFENNVLEDFPPQGTQVAVCICCSKDVTIKNNIINNCSSGGTLRGAIWMGNYYGDGENIIIDGNIINNSGTYGIGFIGNGGNGYDLTNVIITNNIIVGGANTQDGIGFSNEISTHNGVISNVFIDNNIVTGCSDWGLDFNNPAGTITDVFIRDNVFSGTAGNLRVGAGVTNEIITDNEGYNPVGVSSIAVSASIFTHIAGATAESVYVSGGTVTDIKKGGNDFGLTSGTFELEPYESILVNYTGTPTMYKSVH